MSKPITLLLVLIFLSFQTTSAAQTAQQQPQREGASQQRGPMPSVDERTRDLKKLDGFFPLYWDQRNGTMLLEIAKFDSDFLFTTGLAAGLGSNDIGLDRGQGGSGKVVRFERA